MDYQEMYRLPVINKCAPTSELNLPMGHENGFMYKLPKIQGTLQNEDQSDTLKELEKRQESIIKQLGNLKNRIESLQVNPKIVTTGLNLLDIVIHCNYNTPPYSLPLACRWLQHSGLKIFTACHVHSSAKQSPQNLIDFLPPSNCTSRMKANVRITLIWKEDVTRDPECFVTMLPNHKIKGEVNLLRFLNRHFGLLRNTSFIDAKISESKSDEWLDRIHSGIIWGEKMSTGQSVGHGGIIKDIEKVLSNQRFLLEEQNPGIVDLLAFTTIKEVIACREQSKTIKKYMNTCQNIFDPSKQNSIGVVN